MAAIGIDLASEEPKNGVGALFCDRSCSKVASSMNIIGQIQWQGFEVFGVGAICSVVLIPVCSGSG